MREEVSSRKSLLTSESARLERSKCVSVGNIAKDTIWSRSSVGNSAHLGKVSKAFRPLEEMARHRAGSTPAILVVG